jgi:WD40 repeat protein
MKALRVCLPGPGKGHEGEVFSCAYTPDGAFVLSGGWDGHLRLWEAASGAVVTALQAGPKPLSACAVAPDRSSWLSGSMEGQLTVWDPVTHQPRLTFMAHIRPISAIRHAPDGKLLATASWDRQVALRAAGTEREGRTLTGHGDIVADCRFTPDGKQLLSWSHDRTLRLWDVEAGRCAAVFEGHKDRVVSAGLSPNGRWAVSASRDGMLKLWDLRQQAESARLRLSELRACFVLPDAASVVTVDSRGWLLLLGVPGMEVQAELGSGLKVLCGELAPSGAQIALGCEDGRVHFVGVDGLEESPLVVPATKSFRHKATALGRLLGKSKLTAAYQYTCPACRHPGEVDAVRAEAFPCRSCRRLLRLDSNSRQLQLH